MPSLGLNFSPTQGNPTQQRPGQPGQTQNPVMDAIKILSFRVPTVLGAGSPVAPGMLAGPGGATPGMGGSDAALIQQWLQRFFGGGLNTAGAVGGGGEPGSPMPGGTPPPQPGRPTVVLRDGLDRGTGSDQAPAPPPPGGIDLPQMAGPGAPAGSQPAGGMTWGDMGGARQTYGAGPGMPGGPFG